MEVSTNICWPISKFWNQRRRTVHIGWELSKKFFEGNNDWNELKKRPCLDLFYITGARYLFVTKILYEQSDKKLKPCIKRTYGGKEYEIPESGVCFPAPYGSATCTSDYDVGLIGRDSGILTRKFNEYFQKTFRKLYDMLILTIKGVITHFKSP